MAASDNSGSDGSGPDSSGPELQVPDDVKPRRKALGWSRAQLADRAGIDPRVVQLIELDQWSEGGALDRVARVLARAEAGETDVHLRKVQAEEGSQRFGNAQEDEVPRLVGGEIPEA